MRESDESRCSMVSEVNENIVLAGGLKNSSSPFSCYCCLVALEYGLEMFRSNGSSGIVNFDSSVDIYPWVFEGRFIEDLPLVRIAFMFGNVVIGKSDDTILIESTFGEQLEGMIDVSLVSVIGVGVRTCNQDSPVVANADSQKETER